jgi:hypothetical protein
MIPNLKSYGLIQEIDFSKFSIITFYKIVGSAIYNLKIYQEINRILVIEKSSNP